MSRVASVAFGRAGLAIKFEDGWNGKAPGVYAFLAAHRVVRVGSSSKGVAVRLRQYPRHINNALANKGLKTPTPLWEALLWQHVYHDLAAGVGEIWARASEPIQSALGVASARICCKVEESIIGDAFVAPGLNHPILNRSSRIS